MNNSSKRTIKNIIIAFACLLLCFVLVFGFAACGTQGEQGLKGDPGAPGTQGEQGPAGKDGEDFTPVAPSVPGDPITETNVAVTGTTSGFLENEGNFYADYATLDEHRVAARKKSVEIAEESIVLLKNDNNALPLNRYERDVTLLGIRSYNPMTGGGGSGAGSAATWMDPTVLTVRTGSSARRGAMEDAGFTVNPIVKAKYSTSGTSELALTEFTDDVIRSYDVYGDAAIVSFARAGSEGDDVSAGLFDSTTGDASAHGLELTEDEKNVVRHAKAHFDKVIVLIQSNNVMEIAELQEKKTDSNLGVDAILCVGLQGAVGLEAVGSVLNGTVNPSGRTADIWASDLMKGPEITNFGRNRQNKVNDNEEKYYYYEYNNLNVRQSESLQERASDGMEDIRYYYLENGKLVSESHSNQTNQEFVSIEYREDIYMGYRYYETVAYEMNKKSAGTGEEWYSDAVVYPFGNGMSYTDFKWEFTDAVAQMASITDATQTITLDIKVTNIGGMEGKDVIQIYNSAPYREGGVEKSHVSLVEFKKTKLLRPQESQTLRIQVVAQDLASFDYNDKSGSGHKGYKLEAGDYTIGAFRDSHTPVLTVTRKVASTINCKKDYTTGEEVNPVFSGGISGGEGYEMYDSMNQTLINNKLSRADMYEPIQPKVNTKADRTVSKELYYSWKEQATYFSYQDKASDPWYVSSVPAAWDQGKGTADATTGMYDLTLYDMAGVPFDEASISASGVATAATDDDSKKWETFMNQLTWDEMYGVVTAGYYGQAALATVGKRLFNDSDGPAQMGPYISYTGRDPRATAGMVYPTANTIAQTWNTNSAYSYGRSVGNDSIFGNMPGWYGPSMNTHRSPFSGRNFEYYSEDGVLAGKMAADAVEGATSKGVVCYAKHMFLNDQEYGREPIGGVFTWASEQAIREIYLKPFEYAVKFGRSTGIMSAFNRIGAQTAAANYALLEQILRGEWNFTGTVVSDSWNGQSLLNRRTRPMNLMVRTGGDLPLGRGTQSSAGGTGNSAGGKLYGLESQTVPLTPLAGTSATEGMMGSFTDPANSEWTRNPAGWSAWDAVNKSVKVAPAWDSTKSDGSLDMANGMLVGETESTPYALSATHYYAVRKAAQRILYSNANSNHLRNGFKDPRYTSATTIKSFTLAQNTAIANNTVVMTAAEALEFTGTSNLIYSVTGTLPAGLTLSSAGVLSGTPTATTSGSGTNVNIDIFLPGGYRIWNARINIVINAA